jgi:hypothetical protein
MSLVTLNLLDNIDIDVMQLMTHIKYLFPRLKDLELNLCDEEDVSFILATLPSLIQLNGIKVERVDTEVEDSHELHVLGENTNISNSPERLT